MRVLGTIVAVVAALIWTVVVWGSYGLLSLSTEFLANNANDLGVAPGAEAAFDWIARLFTNYGSGTAGVVWAMGLLAIILLRAIYNWLIGMATGNRDAVRSEAPVFQPAPPVVQSAPAPTPPQIAVPDAARWGRDATGR